MAAPKTFHFDINVLLGMIPAIVTALGAALTINRETGHASAAKIVNDSIAAAATVAGLIPESHVQAAAQIVNALAPTVAAAVGQGNPTA